MKNKPFFKFYFSIFFFWEFLKAYLECSNKPDIEKWQLLDKGAKNLIGQILSFKFANSSAPLSIWGIVHYELVSSTKISSKCFNLHLMKRNLSK